jgi:methylated-DNA-[protein]-cysteine S-methyltransferase
MTTYYTYWESPLNPLLLASNGAALVGLYLNTPRHALDVDGNWTREDEALPFGEAKQQMRAYFAGERREFTLPLAPSGTEWQRRVWDALRQIPYGSTETYSGIARRIGSPHACRAIGHANGRNPLSIIVPCHRVVSASGKMVGYSGAIWRKEALLSLEKAALTTPSARGRG